MSEYDCKMCYSFPVTDTETLEAHKEYGIEVTNEDIRGDRYALCFAVTIDEVKELITRSAKHGSKPITDEDVLRQNDELFRDVRVRMPA